MKKITISLLMLIIASSCGDDLETGGTIKYERRGKGVFVCNEGVFNSANASLTYYDPASGEVDREIYYNANNIPLGDVCQSMNIIDGRAFAVVNNSGKIVIIDPVTFKYTGVVSGLVSPRFIEPAGNGKLYISDLYDPNITIVDRHTLEVTGKIDTGINPLNGLANGSEQMVLIGRYMYVCSWSYNDKVFRIDTTTDRIDAVMTVASQPNSMAADRYGNLWVLSDGSYEGSPTGWYHGALTCIDTETFTEKFTLQFPDKRSAPQKLATDSGGSTLYYVNSTWSGGTVDASGIYAMSVESRELPAEPLIDEGDRLFYGLGVDPDNSDIYVSDANDYVQEGTVYRYSASGRLISQFRAGLTPAWFCFKR